MNRDKGVTESVMYGGPALHAKWQSEEEPVFPELNSYWRIPGVAETLSTTNYV